ncbi:MAG: extracellular solute-binding protein [Lachnospiraceae bacterium]|nr:extracellular solute-binding protein [Lachnospiraceae bacterium]
MKNRNNRVFALLLAGTMMLGLAACGSAGSTEGTAVGSTVENEGTKESDGSTTSGTEETANTGGSVRISEEEITLTVGGLKPSGLEDVNNLAALEEYRNRLGINLEANFTETDWPTQRTLMFAGNELPDMLFNASMSVSDVNNYGSQGYLLDFNAYRDIMPNMVAAFEQFPELEAFLTTEDGHIYGMTQLRSDMTDRLMRTFVNRNWLANLGMEAPTTLDELYDVLVAFKEQDANGNGDTTDEIPFLWDLGGYQGGERTILDAFGIYPAGWGGFTYILQADENNQVQLANISDNYKEFLKFMRKLYEEGLMEQEAFTLAGDVATARAREDRYGFFGCGSAPFVLTQTDISSDKNWIGVAGLESEYNPDKGVSIISPVVNNIALVASADTEYPEEIARFVDYFFSEEGMFAGAIGYEGQGWDWNENEALGVKVPKWRVPEGYASAEEYRYKGSVFNNCLNMHESNLDRVALFEVPVETLQKDEVMTEFGWAALVAAAYRSEGITDKAAYPIVAYTNEENDRRSTLVTDVANYIAQMRAEFITGQTDIDAGWETYVNTVNQMGMSQLLEIEQAAYDRYLAVGAK